MNEPYKRRVDELPQAVAEWGWRFHHLGIPTTEKIPNETYIPHLKIYVGGFESSPYGIEWMRFEEGCTVPELVRTVPHLAFEVNDLAEALQGKEVISNPSSPSAGVTVAMIKHQGAPVELLEFES